MSLSSETTSDEPIIPIVGGSQANKTGNTLELFVERCLQDNGYTEFWDHKEQVFENRKLIGGKQFVKQCPCGTSIYETKRKCDFLVINQNKFKDNLIIECKWQQSSGSVDEKYPFTVFNVFKIGVPTIILLDGGGYKPAAMQWLKDQVNPQSALIGVYSMAEFQKLVNQGFLG